MFDFFSLPYTFLRGKRKAKKGREREKPIPCVGQIEREKSKRSQVVKDRAEKEGDNDGRASEEETERG